MPLKDRLEGDGAVMSRVLRAPLLIVVVVAAGEGLRRRGGNALLLPRKGAGRTGRSYGACMPCMGGKCRWLGWSWGGGARALVLGAEALHPRGGSAMLKHTSLCEEFLWKEMGRVLDQVLVAGLVFERDHWLARS